jgi:hypothetical protein
MTALATLAAVDGHEHNDEECLPCARDGCGHLTCEHKYYPPTAARDYHECEQPGCDCQAWLADQDCPACDGTGVEEWGTDWRGQEHEGPCNNCGGTGVIPPKNTTPNPQRTSHV